MSCICLELICFGFVFVFPFLLLCFLLLSCHVSDRVAYRLMLFCFISSHLISSHLISSHLISSCVVWSGLALTCLVVSCRVLSYLVMSYLVLSCLVVFCYGKYGGINLGLFLPYASCLCLVSVSPLSFLCCFPVLFPTLLCPC